MSNLMPHPVFELNSSFHLCGDATKPDSYLEVLSEGKAQLVLADPPYCLLTRRRKGVKERDPKPHKIYHEAVRRFLDFREYFSFTKGWMNLCFNQFSDTGSMIIWTNFIGSKAIRVIGSELGLVHHGDYVWAKITKEGSGNERLARVYEFAIILSRNPKPQLSFEDCLPPRHHISYYDPDRESGDWEHHPNHKAFSVLEPLIRYYSKPGDRILDPFTGSGSTPAASIRLNRFVSGLELREKWAQITQGRMRNTQDALL